MYKTELFNILEELDGNVKALVKRYANDELSPVAESQMDFWLDTVASPDCYTEESGDDIVIVYAGSDFGVLSKKADGTYGFSTTVVTYEDVTVEKYKRFTSIIVCGEVVAVF